MGEYLDRFLLKMRVLKPNVRHALSAIVQNDR